MVAAAPININSEKMVGRNIYIYIYIFFILLLMSFQNDKVRALVELGIKMKTVNHF